MQPTVNVHIDPLTETPKAGVPTPYYEPEPEPEPVALAMPPCSLATGEAELFIGFTAGVLAGALLVYAFSRTSTFSDA